FFFVFFFFSSRRRHTRWPRDWSSDVCSSDLSAFLEIVFRPKGGSPPGRKTISRNAEWLLTCVLRVWKTPHARDSASHTTPAPGSASHENAGSHRPQFWRFESRAYNTRPVRCRDSALPFAAGPQFLQTDAVGGH